MKEKNKNVHEEIKNYKEYFSIFFPKSNIELINQPNSPEEMGTRMADETLVNLKDTLEKNLEKKL